MHTVKHQTLNLISSLQIKNKISKNFITLVIIGIAANAFGLFNDILEPDGALYATIAKYIATKNDWINLFGNGDEWLDKPHLPFWITALSFKVFGVNSFAYKLPSFICFLIGCIYTYKLSLKIFNKETAQLSTIIYITSLHVILSNFDVRAEGYLTAFIVAAIYHFYCAMQKPWLVNIAVAALYTALAMMTKGIFVLITIGSGFAVYWILTKQWKQFIHPKWYLYVALSFVFITPELYCLYQQFDLHPEKIVFGTTHISGLKFFFWDSQFGRFFNTGPIQGEGDLLFFVHTTLWAFLPWAIYIIAALYKNVKQLKAFVASSSTIIYASALCSFLLFSISKFQLPHYIVIIFPQLSMLVAVYLLSIVSTKTIKALITTQTIVFVLLGLFILMSIFIYKLNNIFIPMSLLAIVSGVFFFMFKEKNIYTVVAKAVCFSVLLSLFLNFIFYPQLMQYQAGMMAGKWQQKNYANTIIPMFKCNEYSFEFYGNTQFKRENNLQELLAKEKNKIVFTPYRELKYINKDSFSIKQLQLFPYYYVTQIKPEFFNKKTRWQLLDTFSIVEFGAKY